jgi:hypothetical protein
MATLRKIRSFTADAVAMALFTGLFALPLVLHVAARLFA